MDMRTFEAIWETEYLCERIKRIFKDVEKGNYASALDYLSMVQQKVRVAEHFIKLNSPA